MERVEAKIGNTWQPIYNNTAPENIWCIAYGDGDSLYDPTISNRKQIINVNMYESNRPYINTLNNYIGTVVAVPRNESVPVLAKIIKQKHDNQGNTVGKEYTNHILDSRLYWL